MIFDSKTFMEKMSLLDDNTFKNQSYKITN